MWGGRYRPSFAHFRGHIAGDLARTLQYAVRQLEIATQKVSAEVQSEFASLFGSELVLSGYVSRRLASPTHFTGL